MTAAKIPGLLFVWALLFALPAQAQRADKGKKAVYKGKTVEQCMVALERKNKWTRRSAAEAPGKLGAVAEKAVPALIQTVKDANKDVRKSAVEAVIKIQINDGR